MAEDKKIETSPENSKVEEAKTVTVPKEDFDRLNIEFQTYKEENEGRIESLQDSLDAALEDQALRGRNLETEEEPPLEKEITEGPPEPGTPAPEPEPAESSVERDIELAIKEDEEFREEILMKEEMRDLKDEMKDALTRYPDADEQEVLLGIEDGELEGRADQVEALAKASQEKIIASREEIITGAKASATEEIQQKLKKENEGGFSVPQSGGTPTSPRMPAEPAPAKPGSGAPGLYDEDEEWSKARNAAKAEGRGE